MSGKFPDPEDDPSVLADRDVWKYTIEYLLREDEASPEDLINHVKNESSYTVRSGHFYMNLGELDDMGIVEEEGQRRRKVYRITDYGVHLARKAQIGGEQPEASLLEPESSEESLDDLLEEDIDELEETFEQEGYNEAKKEARERVQKYLRQGRPDLADELERHMEGIFEDQM
jgi:DNA-binding PadR family transcriptional regulator